MGAQRSIEIETPKGPVTGLWSEVPGARAVVAIAHGAGGNMHNGLLDGFAGTHPETGEDLEFVDHAPERFAPYDLPPQEDVFAPDYAPEEITEIAQKLRTAAGLPKKVTGIVADGSNGKGRVKAKI